MASPWQRRAQGLCSGSTHAGDSGGGGNAWAASTAGYPAKAIGVARSDLEHYADLQATLRPENRLAVFYHSHPLGRYSMTVVSRRIGDQFTLATHAPPEAIRSRIGASLSVRVAARPTVPQRRAQKTAVFLGGVGLSDQGRYGSRRRPPQNSETDSL
jgi:hypothetical protein